MFDTLISVLNRHVERKGDEVLYNFVQDDSGHNETLTYRQLQQQAQVLAQHLTAQGEKGQRAIMLFDNGPQFVVAFFACLMAGIVAVPVYPPRKRDDGGRLVKIVDDAKPTMVLTSRKIATLSEDIFANQPAFTHLIKVVTEDCEQPLDVQLPNVQLEDPAFLQYSSGSTGSPKGVIISHLNIVHNQACFATASGNDESSSISSWLPYFHDMGLSGGILQPAFVGFPCYLMNPTFFLQKPVRWLKVMSDYKVRTSGAPNFAWELCLNKITDDQLEGMDLSHWRVAYHGAEPIQADTLRRFAERFGACGFDYEANFPCYGMAESTLFISGRGFEHKMPVVTLDGAKLAQNKVLSRQQAESVGQSIELPMDVVSCGRAWLDSQIRIVEPQTGKPLEDGLVGEVWFASDSVALGYWNNSQVSAEVFGQSLTDTIDSHNGRYLRTGDMGFIHDGELYITGRLKDLIIVHGRNYYPQDIEIVVYFGDSQLADGHCAAFSTDGDKSELVVVQEVSRTAMRKLDAPATIKAIRDRVAEATGLALDDVVLIRTGSIAKTSSGKVQRKKNKADYLAGNLKVVASYKQELDADFATDDKPEFLGVASRDQQDLVNWIKQYIAKQTGSSVDGIGIHDNFMSMGLNSLKAVEFADLLGQFCQQSLSPTLVYDYPNIALLVAYLTGDESLHRDVNKTEQDRDIAVIGIACRLPGADNLEQLWRNIAKGRLSLRPFPEQRQYGVEPQGLQYQGGYLDDIDAFDDKFFRMTVKEAKLVDPQHRILLELAHNAMRHAGYQPWQLQGSNTGVFVGISQSEYMLLVCQSEEFDSAYFGTGTAMCMAANRISYFYDFTGPSSAIDTACSSSLVALDAGVKSLRLGECEQALVGGIKILPISDGFTVLKQAQMLSPTGSCHSFDAQADGYVRAEGGGVLMLKPLNKALQDNDNVYGVIKGVAVNQDGRSNGITAPNGHAQQQVIEQALLDANVAAHQVSYVEAHGTGTPLGDPIEVNALANVYGKAKQRSQDLLIGSIKANIGHLEPAAGMAGLIKTLLCMQHRTLPAQANFNQANDFIHWQDMAVKVVSEDTSWTASDTQPLLAGVSSFGFGGTNTHAILMQGLSGHELPTQVSSPTSSQTAPHILALKAHDEASLNRLKLAFARHIDKHQDVPLDLMCRQYNQQLEQGSYGFAALGDSHQQLAAELVKQPSQSFEAVHAVGFMFSGQGCQYVNMARGLFDANPVFKQYLLAADDCYQMETGKSLLTLIFADEVTEQHVFGLNQTENTQPALFAIEYALAQLWLALGVKPKVLLGHSIGEYAAACIAGVFSLADAIKLVVARGKLLQALPDGGGMMAVNLSAADVAPKLAEFDLLDFGAVNGPQSVVVSGDKAQLAELKQQLLAADDSVLATELKVSHAFHSGLMTEALAPFKAVASSISYQQPQLPFVSTVTGQLVCDELTEPDYWVKHISQSVLFADALEYILANDEFTTGDLAINAFVEIGPDQVLTKMAAKVIGASEQALSCFASLYQSSEQDRAFYQLLAQLFSRQLAIDWAGIYPVAQTTEQTVKLPLPAYPFARNRFWVTVNPYFSVPEMKTGALVTEGANVDLPKVAGGDEQVEQHLYTVDWQAKVLDSGVNGNERYLLLSADNEVSQQLMTELNQQLTDSGASCQLVNIESLQSSKDWAQLLASAQADVIVHGASLMTSTDDLTACQLTQCHRQSYGSALHLIQGLVDSSYSPRCCFVTHNAQNQRARGWLQQGVWGLAKVTAQEYPQLNVASIDVSGVESIPALIAEINCQGNERQVLLDGDKRDVARLTEVAAYQLADSIVNFSADCSYLITGGLGDLALATAKWLVQRGAQHIVLMARRALDSSSDEFKLIALMQNQGARVDVVQVDATDFAAVEALVLTLDNSDYPLGGIFHFAGLLQDKSLPLQSFDDFTQVSGVKADCAWALHRATVKSAQLGLSKLSHFVCLSSAAALLGSSGQANYAAANSMLDGLILYRRQLGLPALSLQLAMVADIGMAAKRGLDKRSGAKGMAAITPHQYIRALERTIGGEHAVVGVVPVEWPLWQAQVKAWPMLSNFSLAQSAKTKGAHSGSPIDANLVTELLQQHHDGASSDQTLLSLTTYLKQQVADIGELSSSDIDTETALLNLGLDSLMLVELQRRVAKDLEQQIEMEWLLKGGSATELAQLLCDGLPQAQGGQVESATVEDEEFVEGIL